MYIKTKIRVLRFGKIIKYIEKLAYVSRLCTK